MGFLEVIKKEEMDAGRVLWHWNNAACTKWEPKICVNDTLLENGTKVFVAHTQVLVRLKKKQVTDVAFAGGYIYHSDLEENGEAKQFAEVLNPYLEKRDDISEYTEMVYINLTGNRNPLDEIKEYIGSQRAEEEIVQKAQAAAEAAAQAEKTAQDMFAGAPPQDIPAQTGTAMQTQDIPAQTGTAMQTQDIPAQTGTVPQTRDMFAGAAPAMQQPYGMQTQQPQGYMGANIPPQPSAPNVRFCRFCGGKLPTRMINFCPLCGGKL